MGEFLANVPSAYKPQGRRPRVVSLVPSWTETLIEAGVEVIGRTDFCIHPAAQVAEIPVVGGTKEVRLNVIKALNPDFILVDQEENPGDLADSLQHPYLATHIESLKDMAPQMHQLAAWCQAPRLSDWAHEWEMTLARPKVVPLAQLIESRWLREPIGPIRRLVYLIWRKPWMAVGPQTFVGSMLTHLGWGEVLLATDEKCAVVEPSDWDERSTLILLPSEPYPFGHHERQVLAELPHALAAIDGEKMSWFGLRSLRFLQSLHK